MFQKDIPKEYAGCHGYYGVQIESSIAGGVLRQEKYFDFSHQ